jgi:hypothetical protein
MAKVEMRRKLIDALCGDACHMVVVYFNDLCDNMSLICDR